MEAEEAWDILRRVHDDGKEPYVPLVRDDCARILLDCVKSVQPERILEIGTAVGYSSSLMALTCGAVIDTVDMDEERIKRAENLWERLGVRERINSWRGDVKQILPSIIYGKKYGLVFMDGPKSAYMPLLEQILPHMEKGGVIVSDNVGYLGLVEGDSYPPHKHRTIVRNMRRYLQYLSQDKFETKVMFDVGDGLAVTRIL